MMRRPCINQLKGERMSAENIGTNVDAEDDEQYSVYSYDDADDHASQLGTLVSEHATDAEAKQVARDLFKEGNHYAVAVLGHLGNTLLEEINADLAHGKPEDSKDFHLTIQTSNDAFADGNKIYEIGRILEVAASKVEGGAKDFLLRDVNGNTVGKAYFGEDLPAATDDAVVLSFSTGNAAFEDAGVDWESARILRDAAERVRDGSLEFNLRDINGNSVGDLKEVHPPVPHPPASVKQTGANNSLEP